MDTDKVEQLRDRLLMCAICMDEYKDPRLLPCHHTVCLECLENYVRASSITGRVFRCPQCRRDVHVPRGGTSEFPINFYIISLQDELGTRTYDHTCDVCQRDWITSQFRCVDCDLVICKFCIHQHRLFQHDAARQYNIMRIKTNPVQSSSSQSCPVHSDEMLKLFCMTCDTSVCITCVCGDHKRHDTVPMATKLSKARGFLQKELDRLSEEKRYIERTLHQVDESSEDVLRCVADVKNEVIGRGDDLHAKIDLIIQSQLKEVTESEMTILHNLGTYSKDLKKYCDETDKGLRFLEDLQEDDMCLELLDCYERYKVSLNTHKSKSANKRIELKKFNFTRGWDVQSFNFFTGNVGKLQWRTFSKTFLAKPELIPFSLRQLLRCVFTKRVLLMLVVALFMMLTFYRLFQAYYDDSEDACAIGVAITLCSYLYLTSIFAYRKS